MELILKRAVYANCTVDRNVLKGYYRGKECLNLLFLNHLNIFWSVNARFTNYFLCNTVFNYMARWMQSTFQNLAMFITVDFSIQWGDKVRPSLPYSISRWEDIIPPLHVTVSWDDVWHFIPVAFWLVYLISAPLSIFFPLTLAYWFLASTCYSSVYTAQSVLIGERLPEKQFQAGPCVYEHWKGHFMCIYSIYSGFLLPQHFLLPRTTITWPGMCFQCSRKESRIVVFDAMSVWSNQYIDHNING